jgi:hypothetical protein
MDIQMSAMQIKIHNKTYIIRRYISQIKTSYLKNDLKLSAHFNVWPVIYLSDDNKDT